MVTLYFRSSLNSSHMSRIWLVVLVLDHGLLYPPCDTRLVYKECKLHCSAEHSLTIISSDKLWRRGFEDHGYRASAVFGNLQEFQPDSEIITAYLERTKIYFTANDVADEKKVAVLLTVIGPKFFTLLRSLTTPELPQDKSFEELEAVLKAHFQPKPLVIAERFHFHRRD